MQEAFKKMESGGVLKFSPATGLRTMTKAMQTAMTAAAAPAPKKARKAMKAEKK